MAQWFRKKGVSDLEKLATALWLRKETPGADDADQERAFLLQKLRRGFPRGAMGPQVGHIPQPDPDLGIGCGHVQDQSCLLEPGGQGVRKAMLEVMIETLDLSLGLGPVGAAKFWLEAMVLGEVFELRLKPVKIRTIAVTLDDHGLHIVVKHLAWHATKKRESLLVAIQ